jgi:hypothetical protein
MRGCRFAGRFAQARGNSSFANAFNAQFQRGVFTGRTFVQGSLNSSNTLRNLSSVFARCAGEIPLNGFAEQYRTITTGVSTTGQLNAANSDVEESAEGQVVVGTSADQVDFVKIAEVPTLFQYCHCDNCRGSNHMNEA